MAIRARGQFVTSGVKYGGDGCAGPSGGRRVPGGGPELKQNFVALSLALAVLLPSCNATTPSADDQAKNSATMGIKGTEVIRDMTAPEQGAASLRLTLLNGSEIRSRFMGQMLMPDRRVRQASMEFAEDFLPDGTWVSRRNQRTRIVKRGAWRIVEDQICVTVTDRSTLCRRVWTDPRGRIAMRDMESPLETILIMSVSPIRGRDSTAE